MRILSFISVALLGAMFMASADHVQAREAGNLYSSLSVGVVFPGDSDDDVTFAGAGGQPIVRNVEVEYDVGYHIEGALGFYMTKDIRFETAVSWREYEFKDSDDDSLRALSFTGNAYIDFVNVFDLDGMMGMNLGDEHEPYIGAGLGFALWEVGGDGDSLGSWFLTNAMAGYNYHINDNLAAGASYRFTYSNPELDNGFEIDQFNHSILVTVTALF